MLACSLVAPLPAPQPALVSLEEGRVMVDLVEGELVNNEDLNREQEEE